MHLIYRSDFFRDLFTAWQATEIKTNLLPCSLPSGFTTTSSENKSYGTTKIDGGWTARNDENWRVAVGVRQWMNTRQCSKRLMDSYPVTSLLTSIEIIVWSLDRVTSGDTTGNHSVEKFIPRNNNACLMKSVIEIERRMWKSPSLIAKETTTFFQSSWKLSLHSG